MMSLMGSVSRGLRAGWGQLKGAGLMSRASVQGLCWRTHDNGMDWHRRWRIPGGFHDKLRTGQAVMDNFGMPISKLEPFFGLARPSYMTRLRGPHGSGAGSNHSSSDGVGSPKQPTAAPDRLSTESGRREINIAVTSRMEYGVVHYGGLLYDLLPLFDAIMTRFQHTMDPEELNGALVLGKTILEIYDCLICSASQLSTREPESRTLKDVSTCTKEFDDLLNYVFSKHRVTLIPAHGLPFNHMEHTVKEFVRTNKVPPRQVLEVVKEGYRLCGEVMRESSVVVSMVDDESTADLTWLRRE